MRAAADEVADQAGVGLFPALFYYPNRGLPDRRKTGDMSAIYTLFIPDKNEQIKTQSVKGDIFFSYRERYPYLLADSGIV